MKMKLNFRAALISVAFLGGSIVPGAVYSGNLLKANGVSTEADAILYYQTIDPSNLRSTQAAWRTVNGFDPGSGNEVVVVGGHKNVSDLGFWRRIEMVIDKRIGYVGNVAYTTFNFESEQDAFLNINAKSIVNMEYSPGPNGDRITKFYIYDAAGNRKNSTFFDPDVATREELFLPNGCAACHGGGNKNFATRGGKTGGGFLAFDFNVFEYGPLTSRAANEANVKKLNQGVMKTNPPGAVKSLINGLYGGNGLPLATQYSAYRPSTWATEPKLWNVVVTDCQGCHTLSEQEVLSLDYWKRNVGSFREEVLKEKLMPNSPFANRRFWSTDHHQTVEDALIRFRP
ncbi:hypothetical protein SKTS_15600 [Sulfurimicrobium lacus]|uniref:Cytochrome c domain-containing protein n=1 Tax=Sulfurimicrobium lacus TaxID=2715678 RepID=A0A6F8VAI3_9PROT|nr:hypothetical protein [Sulfurimicrobium lacus]BCB26674.1 hypothetical protein SKTS_15600 [Sulfurimicrobium lacus]